MCNACKRRLKYNPNVLHWRGHHTRLLRIFFTQVVKGIITVKWISYGWRYMALLLAEHLLFMALMITYLVLIINENEVCGDHEVSPPLANNVVLPLQNMSKRLDVPMFTSRSPSVTFQVLTVLAHGQTSGAIPCPHLCVLFSPVPEPSQQGFA